jgi:SAM-dependent methyltransferase
MAHRELDPNDARSLARQVGIDFGASLTVALAYIGDRLGIFETLADKGPLTAEQLAERTGLNERYIREWLATMAAAHYVDYDPSARSFAMNAAQRTVLLDQRSPLNMAGSFQYAIACIRQLPALTEAFRHGGGVRFADFGAEISDAIRRMFQAGYESWVAAEWIPTVPDIFERLKGGGRAAEIGCGSGQCLIPVARAFPNSEFVGYDLDPASLERARRRIKQENLEGRVRCERVAAEDIPEHDYFDLIMAFNCIHDMANPRGALKAARRALKPDGVMLWSEAKASDRLEENLSSWGRSMYAASTMHCMTVSLATGGEGLGSVIGEGLASDLAREAGFAQFGKLPVENQFHQIFMMRKR